MAVPDYRLQAQVGGLPNDSDSQTRIEAGTKLAVASRESDNLARAHFCTPKEVLNSFRYLGTYIDEKMNFMDFMVHRYGSNYQVKRLLSEPKHSGKSSCQLD